MVIGVTGHAGAGKDSVAKFLQEIVGEKCKVMAFADPLKKICKELFDFSDEQLWGALKEKSDMRYPRIHKEKDGCAFRTFLTPRYAMQSLGTEWGRDCYESIWVDYAMRRAKEFLREAELVVITDCRFLNEAEAIRSSGGQVWRVLRPGYKGLVGATGHASETEQRDIRPDVTIPNDGTLVDLRRSVAHFWEKTK